MLQKLTGTLAELDMLISLSATAKDMNFVRPVRKIVN